jgi:hypothetical protein
MSRIVTFRGLLADGAQERIPLQTNNGLTGYRIIKFQVIQEQPGQQDTEATVTISKVPFTPLSTIDLSDNTILAVAFFGAHSNAKSYPMQDPIIFDQEIFNQDIYVGNQDLESRAMNYYIELEQMDLALDEATVATLKNIRNND